MNDIKIFENDDLNLQVRTIVNEDGSISINAEDTAIGFGWCRTEIKNGKPYNSIMWARMNKFCEEIGFAHKCAKDDYIPEPLFYRLGMKASNEAADKFQNWLAFDVIPSIRKTGTYSLNKPVNTLDAAILNGAAKLINANRLVMKDQGSHPSKIAQQTELIYRQSGVVPINGFVEKDPFENQLFLEGYGESDD